MSCISKLHYLIEITLTSLSSEFPEYTFKICNITYEEK